MVSAAVVAGLAGVVMTEHLPLPDALNPGGSFAPSDDAFRAYVADVRSMAERVKGIDVVLGAEADWLPHRPETMESQLALVRECGVAVLMGSVHCLGDWPFDSPNHLGEWDTRGADAVFADYFRVWCEAAASGRFDVMAHPDLPKKFGHRPSFDVSRVYDEMATAARDGGALIEVSTGGLRKPVGELYPGHDLLRAFRSAGVDATVGSDAHTPGEVAYGLDAAYDALTAAGYTRAGLPLGGGEVRWIDIAA